MKEEEDFFYPIALYAGMKARFLLKIQHSCIDVYLLLRKRKEVCLVKNSSVSIMMNVEKKFSYRDCFCVTLGQSHGSNICVSK